MSRGQISTIRDPAFAVAAAKCWLARWNQGAGAKAAGLKVSGFHPEECVFCDFPTDKLGELVAEFSDWAGMTPTTAHGVELPVRPAMEQFYMLPREEQGRLVRKAQGYE